MTGRIDHFARLIGTFILALALVTSNIAAAGASGLGHLRHPGESAAWRAGPVHQARFISPDDWDPTLPGVGTNRYAYAGNDPINKSDPSGHIGFVGAAIGAAFGLAAQAAMDAYSGEFSGVGAYGAAAVGGAVAGATAGLAAMAGVGVVGASVTGGAVGGAAGQVAADGFAGKAPTVGGVLSAAGVGAISGALGVPGGKALASSLNAMSNTAKGRLGEALTRANEGLKGYYSVTKAARVDIPGKYTPTGRTSHARFDHNLRSVFTGNTKIGESKWGTSRDTPNQKAAKELPGINVETSRHTAESTAGTASGAVAGGGGAAAQRSENDE